MKKAIVATKVGMTQIFNEDGVLTPVTVLEAGPVYVTQIKNEETDGYVQYRLVMAISVRNSSINQCRDTSPKQVWTTRDLLQSSNLTVQRSTH
mgnify:CR=1 FL=1